MIKNVRLLGENILNEGAVLDEDAIEILEEDIRIIARSAVSVEEAFNPPKNGTLGQVLTKTETGIEWRNTLNTENCYTKNEIISMIGPNNVASNIKFNTEKSVVSAINTLYDLYNGLDGDTNTKLKNLSDELNEVTRNIENINTNINTNTTNIETNKGNIETNTQNIEKLSNSLNKFLGSNEGSSLSLLLEDIKNIKIKNSDQDTRIDDLENNIKPRIDTLEENLSKISGNLSNKITALEDDNKVIHNEIKECNNLIDSIKKQLSDINNGTGGGNDQADLEELQREIQDIKYNITNIINDINGLNGKASNIDDLLTRVTAAEDRLNGHDENIGVIMNTHIPKLQNDIDSLGARVTETERGILLNLANGEKQGTLIQSDYRNTKPLDNNADGENSVVFGTNNIIHTEYGFAIGKYCNHLEDQENNPIFFVGHGTSKTSLLNLLSMSVENTYLHSNNIIIDNNLNVANASINELTSYKIIIPSLDSGNNSCELSVAGVFKDSEGNLGNNSTILSSDNTGRPVWKKINLDLISDGGIDYVGRFFNTNANQHPTDTITSITQGEIFNDYVNNKAPGDYSHAEGYLSYAIGTASHAGGNKSAAVGDACFAHGWNIIAGKTVNSNYGDYNYEDGTNVDDKFNQQFIVGRNNVCNQNTIFAVGCGASSDNRKNVFEATSSGINVDGTIASTGNITSPNITDIDNRLTNLEHNGNTSDKLNNIKNLLIDGYIGDISGTGPKNNQILSWEAEDEDGNGNLKWINCTAIDSSDFKFTELISSWYNTTINGVQVYSKDITHNFKNKNGDTFTDPRSIEVIAYNSENVRVYLSYKVYADDLNKITVYSPVNDNMFIIVKQI